MEAGKRPPITKELTAPKGFVDLVKECWHQNPDSRPTFQIVQGRLQTMLSECSMQQQQQQQQEKKVSRRRSSVEPDDGSFESADDDEEDNKENDS